MHYDILELYNEAYFIIIANSTISIVPNLLVFYAHIQNVIVIINLSYTYECVKILQFVQCLHQLLNF